MHPVLVYALLVVAIIFEVLGTSALKATQEFTRPLPTLLMVLCYGAAFYCLSWTLRTIPVGIAYGVWSGLGVVLISLVGIFVYGQKLDLAAIIGLGLIIAGVVILNVFSSTAVH